MSTVAARSAARRGRQGAAGPRGPRPPGPSRGGAPPAPGGRPRRRRAAPRATGPNMTSRTEHSRMRSNEMPASGTAAVEVVSWVTRSVGGDGTGRRAVEEPLPAGATVRSVLAGLSARYPELHAALWHGEALGEHIEVLVNDAVLDLHHTLHSPLAPGDRLTLLGQFMGG